MLTWPCCAEPDAHPSPLSPGWVAKIRNIGLGPELDARTTVVDETEYPLWTSAHECSHAAAGLAVGAKVGMIERYLACVDRDGLPLADQLLVNTCGTVGGMLAQRSIRYRFDDEWLTFIGRARRGASRCDECNSCHAILQDNPSATDGQVIATMRQAERRALDFLDRIPLWGLIMCAAKELHTEGKMTGERLAEILGD